MCNSKSEGKGIYNDTLLDILKDCCDNLAIKRASRVETEADLPPEIVAKLPVRDPLVWWVDFTPSGYEILMGPYPTRSEALQAEKEKLRELLNPQ